MELRHLYVGFLLMASIAIDVLALGSLINVNVIGFVGIAMIAFMGYIGLEVATARYIGNVSKPMYVLYVIGAVIFFVFMAFLARPFISFVLNEMSSYYFVFLLTYFVISVYLTYRLAKRYNYGLGKRLIIYVMHALVLAGFIIVYAFLAAYITYEAGLNNLRDKGRRAPIKKLTTYISGTLLLAYNLVLLVAEALGLYEPNPNMYYVSALIVLTVIFAVRNMMRYLPKEGRLEFLVKTLLPSFIALYISSYVILKLNSLSAVIDGLAKSVAALAAIIAPKEEKEDFL